MTRERYSRQSITGDALTRVLYDELLAVELGVGLRDDLVGHSLNEDLKEHVVDVDGEVGDAFQESHSQKGEQVELLHALHLAPANRQ